MIFYTVFKSFLIKTFPGTGCKFNVFELDKKGEKMPFRSVIVDLAWKIFFDKFCVFSDTVKRNLGTLIFKWNDFHEKPKGLVFLFDLLPILLKST